MSWPVTVTDGSMGVIRMAIEDGPIVNCIIILYTTPLGVAKTPCTQYPKTNWLDRYKCKEKSHLSISKWPAASQ